MKKTTITRALVLVLLLTGCSVFKKTLHTAADAARILCELWATDEGGQDKLGMTPADFCAIADNVRPFIDAALAAQRNAGSAVGARVGIAPKPDDPPDPRALRDPTAAPENVSHGEP
jgi:hypothetical protein